MSEIGVFDKISVYLKNELKNLAANRTNLEFKPES